MFKSRSGLSIISEYQPKMQFKGIIECLIVVSKDSVRKIAINIVDLIVNLITMV